MRLKSLVAGVAILSGGILAARTARADFTPTVNGNLNEWNALDPTNTFALVDTDTPTIPLGQNGSDIDRFWVSDSNTTAQLGSLFVGMHFVGSPNNCQTTLQMDIDTNNDGIVDERVTTSNAANCRVVVQRPLGTTVFTSAAGGTACRRNNGNQVLEFQIPYAAAGLNLTHGTDTFTYDMQTVVNSVAACTGATLGQFTDFAPNGNVNPGAVAFTYNGPGQDTANTILLPTVSSVTEASMGLVLATKSAQGGVELSWSTGAERHNVGFQIYKWDPRGRWVALPDGWSEGLGDSPLGRSYTVRDPAGSERDQYVVADVALNGQLNFHGPIAVAHADLGGDVFATGIAMKHGTRAPADTTMPIAKATGVTPVFGNNVKISVTQGGLVRVPFADLAKAGSSWTPMSAPRVTFLGKDVPAWASSTGDLLFYARATDDQLRAEDVYELISGATGDGASRGVIKPSAWRVATAPTVFTATAHTKSRKFYSASAPDDDYFAMDFASPGNAKTYPVTLDGVANVPASTTVTVSAKVRGFYDFPGITDAYHAAITVGGKQIGEARFDGTEGGALVATTTLGDLQADGHIEISAIGDTAAPYQFLEIDSFDVSYPRTTAATGGVARVTALSTQVVRVTNVGAGRVLVIDVTDESNPVRLTGVTQVGSEIRFQEKPSSFARPMQRTYLIVAEAGLVGPTAVSPVHATPWALLGQVAGVEDVIVTAAPLREAAENLASYRNAHGISAAVVDVSDIYDAYASGNHGADGLFGFLGDLATSATPPRYVTLFGGASLDPRDFLGSHMPDFVPSPLNRKELTSARAWSDQLYVLGAEGVPVIALGRIPAHDLAEGKAYVQKVEAYEESLKALGPTGRALFMTDVIKPGDDDFVGDVQKYAQAIGSVTPSFISLTSATAHTDLIAGMAAGVDILAYVGHGNSGQWGTDVVLANEDAPTLTGTRPSFILSGACLDGMYTNTNTETFAWVMQAKSSTGAGAIGALASTTLTDPAAATKVNTLVLTAIYTDGAKTWGDAILSARQKSPAVSTDSATLAHIDAMSLLGDPALSTPLAR